MIDVPRDWLPYESDGAGRMVKRRRNRELKASVAERVIDRQIRQTEDTEAERL